MAQTNKQANKLRWRSRLDLSRAAAPMKPVGDGLVHEVPRVAALTHRAVRLPCAASSTLRALHGALTWVKALSCAVAGGAVAHQGFISLLYGWVVIT